MKLRKIMSMLLAVALMFTMAISVSAEGETITFVTDPASIYENDLFTLSLRINGAGITEIKGAQVSFTYDATKIVPVNANGEELTAFDAGIWAEAIPSTHMIMNPSLTKADGVGTITVVMGRNYGATSIPVTDGEIDVFNFNFKALAKGDVPLTLGTAIQSYFSTDAATVVPTYTAKTITVQEMPDKPEITAATVGGTLKAGTKATADYTWDNGNKSGTTTDGDVSVINWTVNGEAVDADADNAKNLTLTNAMVGKTVAYSVLPTADRADNLNNKADAPVSATAAAVVAPADGYAPVATVTLAEESIATLDVEYTVELDDVTKAFGAATDETTIAWYVAETAVTEEAGLEGLTPVELEEGEAYAPAVADRDKYAVLVVTPSVKVGETSYPGAKVIKSTLIKGEPPVLAEGADAVIEKLAAKKFFTSSTPDVTDVEFESKVVEGAVEENYDKIDYSYAWYLTSELKTADTFVADEATAITAEAALATPGKVKLSKVEATEGKYLVAVITATDALTISSSTTVFFTNPIKKATGGSGTQGGASLVTGTQGGTVVEPDEPAVEPEKDPADPAGEANDKGATVFTDVDKEVYAWGYDYLDKLAKAGVVKGMTETTYAPEEETTYAQFTALVVRVLGLTAEEAATEKVAADHWSFAEVSVADKLGILADVAFDADKAITREDMAAIAHKALVAKAVELKAGETVEYSDASAISEYAAAAIDAMSKAGILNGMGDGTFAPKGTTTRMQTAKVIGMISELIG